MTEKCERCNRPTRSRGARYCSACVSDKHTRSDGLDIEREMQSEMRAWHAVSQRTPLQGPARLWR